MTEQELLILLRKIDSALYSHDFRRWLNKQSVEVKKELESLRDKTSSYLIGIETDILNTLADKLDELNDPLRKGIKELREEIKKAEDFVKVIDTLGKVVNLISRVVSLVAVPEVALAGTAVASLAAMEETLSFRSTDKASHILKSSVVERPIGALPPEEDAVDGQSENEAVVDSPVEQIPVEEILHGIELTPESVVITVATGGRTEKNSFEVDVVPGNTGLSPYLVIIYRVKSDDSKGDFEPIRISFSRKELGLEGKVDFRVLNRIGNTSQHRLNS